MSKPRIENHQSHLINFKDIVVYNCKKPQICKNLQAHGRKKRRAFSVVVNGRSDHC